MESMTLRVPYMVVSSVVRDDNEVEKRVQTPFGSVDISLRGTGRGQLHLPVEVLVEVNFAVPGPSSRFRNDFFQNLANFSFEIARDCMNLAGPMSCDIELRLIDEPCAQHLIRPAGSPIWLAPGTH